MTPPAAAHDWTSGPAKWAAVAVLGGGCLLGVATAVFNKPLGPRLVAPQSAPTGQPSHAGASNAGGSTPAPLSGKIDLNTATAAQLEALPGIGPALSGAILQRRREVGRFGSIEELDGVRGIGPKRIDQLKQYLIVVPAAPTPPAAPAAPPATPGA